MGRDQVRGACANLGQGIMLGGVEGVGREIDGKDTPPEFDAGRRGLRKQCQPAFLIVR